MNSRAVDSTPQSSNPFPASQAPRQEDGILLTFPSQDDSAETESGGLSLDPPPSTDAASGPVLLPVHRGLAKVPTIASETDLRQVEAQRRRVGPIDPRRARALRRKLFLDLYREAAGIGFI